MPVPSYSLPVHTPGFLIVSDTGRSKVGAREAGGDIPHGLADLDLKIDPAAGAAEMRGPDAFLVPTAATEAKKPSSGE